MTVEAAGGVVLATHDAVLEVLLVHRPRWDDWSLPKGKLERGETHVMAAAREVLEETGVEVTTLCELTEVRYLDHRGRPKRVRWWLMRPAEALLDGGAIAVHPLDPAEIDRVEWVPVSTASQVFTHPSDGQTFREAVSAWNVQT